MVEDVLSLVPKSWFDEAILNEVFEDEDIDEIDDAEKMKVVREFTEHREVTFAAEIRMERLEYALKTNDFDDFLKQPALPNILDNFTFSAVSPVSGDAKSVHLQVRRKSATLKVTAQDHDWIDMVLGKVRRVINANRNSPHYRLLATQAEFAGFLLLLPVFALALAVLLVRGPLVGLESGQIIGILVFVFLALLYVGAVLGNKYLRQPYWRILMTGARAEGPFVFFVIGLTAGLAANAIFFLVNALV